MNRFVRFGILLSILLVSAFSLSAYDLVYNWMPYFTLEQFKGIPNGTLQISSNCNYDDDADFVLRFDEDGRLIARESQGLQSGDALIEYFIWEQVGDVCRLKESILESHGSDVSYSHAITHYKYDNEGRIVGRVTEIKMSCPPDLLFQDGGNFEVTYLYNDEGQIVSIMSESADNEWDNLRIDYEYDFKGNIVTAVEKSPVRTFKQSYEYDYYGNRVRAISVQNDESNCQVSEYMTANEYGDGNIIVIRTTNDAFPKFANTGVVTYTSVAEKCMLDRDPLNPYASWNSGKEPFASFLERFCKDQTFRDERSGGIVVCDRDDSLVSILLNYPNLGFKKINYSNEVAMNTFGPVLSSPDMLSSVYPLSLGGKIYCYGGFIDMSKDYAIAEINTNDRNKDEFFTNKYYFARKDGKWYLIAVSNDYNCESY